MRRCRRRAAARAEVGAQLHDAAVVAIGAERDQQADAIQRGEIGRHRRPGLWMDLHLGQTEAQEGVHAAFAVEHAIHARSPKPCSSSDALPARSCSDPNRAKTATSQFALKVRPKASVTPASSSASRPSSSHNALTCGAMYQLPSAAPPNAVPVVNAAAKAHRREHRGCSDSFHGLLSLASGAR